jgi:hypothetical protein
MIWYKARMWKRQQLFRSALVGAYFAVAFALLHWYAGNGYFCARTGPMRTTLRLAVGCTIWDLFTCSAGSWLANMVMKLRIAAPLLSGAFTAAGLASIPFWIYRGYGHFLFEGTWIDVSCFFTEANGLAFPFVVAPALAILSLLHCAALLRISKELPSNPVVSSTR